MLSRGLVIEESIFLEINVKFRCEVAHISTAFGRLTVPNDSPQTIQW